VFQRGRKPPITSVHRPVLLWLAGQATSAAAVAAAWWDVYPTCGRAMDIFFCSPPPHTHGCSKQLTAAHSWPLGNAAALKELEVMACTPHTYRGALQAQPLRLYALPAKALNEGSSGVPS
jgi:hypothetical protein